MSEPPRETTPQETTSSLRPEDTVDHSGRRRAFVAFAGGGAKGIAHVGALKALEQRNVQVLGYAGTSAGAMIAALAASGFEADRILHPELDGGTIIDLLNELDPTIRGPTDLFGPNGWREVAQFRWAREKLTAPRLIGGVAIAAGAALLSAIAIGWYGFPIAVLIILTWIMIAAVASVVTYVCLTGLARLHTLRDAFAGLLSRQVFPDDPTRAVKMRDFDGIARPALKIVAANLTKQRLELFSADTTADTDVADAIAASICLPVVFDLWTYRGDRFMDGGIVSNLPAWPFDEERELDPAATTVAFSIAEATPVLARGPGRADWAPSMLQTMMFGSTSLGLRAVGPSELIILKPEIGMMDFDIAATPAREVLKLMTTEARAEIDERLFRFPETYRAACQEAVKLVQTIFDRSPNILKSGARTGRIRVAVAMQPKLYQHSLRLDFGANFEDDTDQSMLLPIDNSLIGVAWNEWEPQFDMRDDKKNFPEDLSLPGERNAPLRRLVWKNLAWSLRVPISAADGQKGCVVTVDGSDVLKDTRATRELFEDLADQIIVIFQPVVRRLQEASSDGNSAH